MNDARRSERRLEAQYAAARVLAESSNLREATPRLLSEVVRAIGWHVGVLWELDPVDVRMRFVELWADDLDLTAFRRASETLLFSRGEGLPGRVWKSGGPLWIEDIAQDRKFTRAKVALESGLRSAFAFPIRLAGRVLGGISIYSTDHHEIDPELLRAMDAVGSQIGQFIERTQAIEEVRRSEARKSAILESALDAVVSMDHRGHVVEFNTAAEKMFGRTRDEVVGEEMAEMIIPPGTREQHREGLRRYLESGQAQIIGRRVELTGMRGDGSTFPVELAITRVDVDGPPLFTGYIRDISERVDAELALHEGQERLRHALDAGRMGAWDWEVDSGRMTWSEQLEQLHGLLPGTFGGTLEAFAAAIHPEDRDRVLEVMHGSAMQDEETYQIEYRIIRADDAVRWIEARGAVERDDRGELRRMRGICTDVTDRREAEKLRAQLLERERLARAEAEAAQQRLAFLSEATAVLGTSLSYERTLERLAALAVPRLADWCIIYGLDEDGSIKRTAMQRADPAKEELAAGISALPLDPHAEEGVPKVIRTGEPMLLEDASEEDLSLDVEDPEGLLELIRPIGVTSWICVPLTARGRTFGAISFIAAESGRRYSDDDLVLATELAGRAAVAVDNARLYQERSYIARTLQQSLLPPALPEIPGVQVAARYAPAGEGFDVGGDFYDLFDRGNDEWFLVMGDICGKGPDAAAVTGLARHTLRAAGLKERRPSKALRTLNQALLQGRSERFCTVALARLEWRGGRLAVTASCGGHPLPQVLRADGVVEEIGRHGTLLGIFPDPDLSEASVELGPGDAVIFYTDGVIEDRRGDSIWEQRSLRAMLQRCAFLGSADAIADCVQAEASRHHGDDATDDIAIMVCRVAP